MNEEQRRIIFELDDNRDGQTKVQQKYLSWSHDASSVNNQSKYKYKYNRDGRVCVHHKSLSLSHEAPLCRLWGAAHSQYGGRVTWHTAVPLKILCNVTLWHMAPFLSVKWAKLVSSYVNIFSTLYHSFNKAASQCTCARRVKKAWAPHPKSHQEPPSF